LTVGERDNRITGIGYFLRKYKLDELPQLFNVLCGDMSLVGPRPEVKKYVDCYNSKQLKVLTVKPGITDWSSIKYRNENLILESSFDPEFDYINRILPDKIESSLLYVENKNVSHYFKIIYFTILSILRPNYNKNYH
jgi:lipopolysaccharide/colanic/teichoic acid biosynthesis glycosyltransferase